MIIGINAQILNDASTGVARYAANMIRALLNSESRHSFVLFGSEAVASAGRSGLKVIPTSLIVRSATTRILWEQFVLPRKAVREGVDLLYYPDHTAALLAKPCKIVITIHDLAFLSMPETHQPGRRIYKSATFRRSVAQSDKIISVSESTQRECVSRAGIPREKIVVIHNGVDPSIQRETNNEVLAAVKQRYHLPDSFILYVGTLERRKNVVRLIYAYGELRKRGGIAQKLVLAGGRGYGYGEVLNASRGNGLAGQIFFPGFVRKEDLSAVYSLADIFVYPSLYEGFGFPPLEAMACGCPVITSNVTSLPEVVGDAGVLVDPSGTTALADAISRLILDKKFREEMVAKGFERVKQFNWQKSARQLLSVFDSMI